MKTEDVVFGTIAVGVIGIMYLVFSSMYDKTQNDYCQGSSYKTQIETWNDTQKTEVGRFCECVIEHPLYSHIEQEDVTPKEFKIVREAVYQTCFDRTMVF
jgi:hypothetical protein